MLGGSDQNKEGGVEPELFRVEHDGLRADHARLAQFANPVPDRGLRRPDLARDLIQGLPGIALQLGKDFPVGVVDLHCLFSLTVKNGTLLPLASYYGT